MSGRSGGRKGRRVIEQLHDEFPGITWVYGDRDQWDSGEGWHVYAERSPGAATQYRRSDTGELVRGGNFDDAWVPARSP